MYVFIDISCITVPVFILQSFANTIGNSIVGRTIELIYFSPGTATFSPQFQCALNDGDLAPCMLTNDCGILHM